MIAHLSLLAFCLALFLLPAATYKSKKLRKICIAMAYSEKCRLFNICITGICIIGFHLIYYACHPNDMGIMISTLFVFASLATRHMLSVLIYFRSRRKLLVATSFIALLLTFIPYMFTTAATMTICLMAISILPTEEQIRRRSNRKLISSSYPNIKRIPPSGRMAKP